MMMLLLEENLTSPLAQVALDEYLWQRLEDEILDLDLLRIWEAQDYAVVLGRGSQSGIELNRSQTERDGVRVLRRITGGAAIVCGPGCLMYSLVVSKRRIPAMQQIAAAHSWVLDRVAERLCDHGALVQRAGISDLALAHGCELRKCSGNCMRLGRRAVLYHGTLLYAMNLSLVNCWLNHPAREPEYRQKRTHESFLANLPLLPEILRQALQDAFATSGTHPGPDERQLARSIETRYANDDWTYCL